jgi:hypothetical protein
MAQISLDIAIPAVRVAFFFRLADSSRSRPGQNKRKNHVQSGWRRFIGENHRMTNGSFRAAARSRENGRRGGRVAATLQPGAQEPNLKRTANGIRGLLITAQRRICIRATLNNRCIRHTQQQQQRRRRQTDGPRPAARNKMAAAAFLATFT